MPMPNPFTLNFGHAAQRLYAAANKIVPLPGSQASTTTYGPEVLVADHLYGLAVECAVKQLLHDYCPGLRHSRGDLQYSCRGHLGGAQRSASALSPDAPVPLRDLVNNDLSVAVSLHSTDRSQAHLAAKLLSLMTKFNDWGINQRYAEDRHLNDVDWASHQIVAKDMIILFQNTTLANKRIP